MPLTLSSFLNTLSFRSACLVVVTVALGCGSKENDGPTPGDTRRLVEEVPLLPEISLFDTETPFVVAGTEVELVWGTLNSTQVAISPAPDRMVEGSSTKGAHAVVMPSATTTYTLTATNPNGSKSKTMTVTVVPGVATNIVVNHAVCDPTRGKLFVSVPSSDPKYGNSIVVVDPVTGAIERTIAIGSEPNQ